MVESQPSKLLVAGSIPVSRSIRLRAPEHATGATANARRSSARRKASRTAAKAGRATPCARRLSTVARAGQAGTSIRSVVLADVAQLAERVLGKDEVTGSSPVIGSIRLRARWIRRALRRMPAEAAKAAKAGSKHDAREGSM